MLDFVLHLDIEMNKIEKIDEKLYKEAEERVSFKQHLRTYAVVNLLIWLFWFFTRGINGNYDGYWPIYATLGWGFGVLMHYLNVYKYNGNAIEREVEKLKRERGLK